MPRDTIAGKISSATSVIADKAVSAKNVVVSKLGYGSSEHREGEDSSKKGASESATEYGYEEKLAPVYEKVAGAGRAVMSKVQRGGGAEHEGRDTVGKDTDKGVSVKEYLAEKFSPGDEDKALSEVITDAFQRKKEGIRRRGEERVKESEDVAARLCTGKENKRDAVAAGGENSGAGVVDRLKGAVSSWLGKSSGSQTTQHSLRQECGELFLFYFWLTHLDIDRFEDHLPFNPDPVVISLLTRNRTHDNNKATNRRFEVLKPPTGFQLSFTEIVM